MVELIVVMILIGILGAIAGARFFSRSGFDVPRFTDQAGVALRFAQKEAIAQNRNVFVRLDGTSISLCYDTNSPCERVIAPFTVSTDSTYCKASDQYCVRAPANVIYNVARSGSNLALPNFIAFDALGRPLDGGLPSLPQLNAATTLTIAAGAQSATVTVEPETGYVH